MNVGILSSRSDAHPLLSTDFVEGIKLFLQKEHLDKEINISIDNIGFGGDEKEIYQKASRLFSNGVDVLVAFIDHRVLSILEPLMYSSGKLLIVVHPGANYPFNWVPQPNIIYLTLQQAFMCALTGSLAAKEAPSGVTASTFYDCGYLHIASMMDNFMRGGGNIFYHYVNRQKLYDETFQIPELIEFLSQNAMINSLLCVFDSLPASLLYTCLNAMKDVDRLKLYASPMMMEKDALQELGKYDFAITGHTSWVSSLQNQFNLEFVDLLQRNEKKPSIFSLLGWETAMILQQILQNKNASADGAEVAEQLTKIKFQSPRGSLQLDAETNCFTSPAYKCSIEKRSPEIKLEEVPAENAWKEFSSKSVTGPSSGWTNTYLCY